MKPIDPKDRPKLIAIVAALLVALGFVVKNLVGTQTQAQPRQEEPIATNPSPAPEPITPDGTPPADAQAAAPVEGEETDESVNVAAAPVQDPFRPLIMIKLADASPAPATIAPPVRNTPPPVLPAVMPVGSGPLGVPDRAAIVRIAAAHRPAGLPSAPVSDGPTAPPQPATDAAPAETPDPAGEVRLVGTVCQDSTALAVFKTTEKALFARPREVIASYWRIIRIYEGGVQLAHNTEEHLLRVGEVLPASRAR